MESKTQSLRGFFFGLISGALGALTLGLVTVYVLNMGEILALSVIDVPDIHWVLGWAYENLRLSVIPFSLTLAFYILSLRKLRHLLGKEDTPPGKISQAEHLVDIWINLFFGIGVIWTAVGMRSALLEGLGGLDAASAAREGAFVILQRLVDGGILLALSTTIFGAVGGYLMRLVKAFTVGTGLQTYYNRIAGEQAGEVTGTLKEIERRLIELVNQGSRAEGSDK